MRYYVGMSTVTVAAAAEPLDDLAHRVRVAAEFRRNARAAGDTARYRAADRVWAALLSELLTRRRQHAIGVAHIAQSARHLYDEGNPPCS